MGLMVTATLAAALVASKLLLEAGVASVMLRYPLAVIAAWLSFLGLIKLWALYILRPWRPSIRVRVPDGIDPIDLTSAPEPRFSGFGGGDSGGGGASDSWGPSLPSVDVDVEGDDGIWVILVLVAVVLAVFGAGVYVIYAAPQILPDVALNVLAAPALTRAAKRAESRAWLPHVLRFTAVPFAVILVMTIILAGTVHSHCPAATKLADALNCPANP